MHSRIRRISPVLAGLVLLGAAIPAPKPHVVNVVARDFALELPASIPAGLTVFQLKNLGRQGHHVSIVRLDSGRTASEALAAIMKIGRAPRPGWMHPVGGPQRADPGGASNAIVVLEPGNYLAFCEVPAPDAAPHYMRGMAKAFTVTGSTREVSSAQGDDTLSLTEYAFTFSRPLTRGTHTIAVTNRGTQTHMVVINRYPPGVGTADFLAWAKDPRGRQSPAIGAGGVTEIPPGATVVFSGRFTPGQYGLICFTPDEKDGKPHFMHGMKLELEVR